MNSIMQDLFMVLMDLTKAFDSVDRAGLWQLLLKIGCPQKFVNIIRSFHEGMMGPVIDDGEISTAFSIPNKDAFWRHCSFVYSLL